MTLVPGVTGPACFVSPPKQVSLAVFPQTFIATTTTTKNKNNNNNNNNANTINKQ